MQKCSNSADKNTDKKIRKTVICDGFACKTINDNKKIKSSKKIMIDLNIKWFLQINNLVKLNILPVL